MEKLGDRVRVRITVQEGENDFILNKAEHRWFARDMWRGKIFYAYGPKLAFLNFKDETISITILEEAEFQFGLQLQQDSV